MNRRTFLGVSAAAAAAMVLDPERLLWVPGAKTFFLPSQQIVTAETMADALRAGFRARVPNGQGWFIDMEITLTGGRDGLTLVERLRRERDDVLRMGGYIVENTQYVQHTIPKGVLA
jgi:hypothetical protein